MRITFLLPTFAPRPSGGFRVVYEYANRLVERGHEVTVVHPRRLPYVQKWPYKGLWPWVRARLGRIRRTLFTPRLTWFPIDPRVRMLFTPEDRKSTRLNSSHVAISYAVFCLKIK